MPKHESPDFTMARMDPPKRTSVSADTKAMLENIEKVRQKADGEWYRVARFANPAGARNRAVTMRRRSDMELIEFTSTEFAEDEDPPYRSGLFARWAGVVSKPGRTKQAELRAVPDE